MTMQDEQPISREEAQMVLVCAPAGFGKTRLVSSWLHQLAGENLGLVPQPTASDKLPGFRWQIRGTPEFTK